MNKSKININFNFINNTADSVRAFYHKSWFFEGGSDFFVASSIFIKKGTHIINRD